MFFLRAKSLLNKEIMIPIWDGTFRKAEMMENSVAEMYDSENENWIDFFACPLLGDSLADGLFY